MNKFAVFLSILFLNISTLFSQQQTLVDKIVGIVGNSIVLQSDIEQQILQYKTQRIAVNRCDVFEGFMVQKLMVNQAKVDSIEVSEANVEMQLNNRIDMYIQQAGSREKLEEYFSRPLMQIKEDMRQPLREQMIMQRMQSEITKDVTITPSEVIEFYNSLSSDSIPMVNTQYEYKQIVIHPPYASQSIYEVRKQLLDLRKQIIDGKNFAALAIVYSEDQGSAINGGEIGFMTRGELDPEYAKAAFSLKEGQVSGIVESQFGFHIIQLIKRDGDRVNTRHILLRPKSTEKEIKAALARIDSIVQKIKNDSITFEKAAFLYSDDKDSRLAYGQVVNPYTNSTKFEVEHIPHEDFFVIKNLKVGEMSEPFATTDASKRTVYKIVKLVNKIEAHKANLKDDYQLLQEMALEHKKKKIIDDWITEKLKTTYIRIDPQFANCQFKYKGWIK